MSYLAVPLPASLFVLVDKDGFDLGPFRADLFAILEDGTMVCAGHGGSPLYLRIVDVDGDWITTLDGTGEAFRYRIVVLDIDQEGRASMPPPYSA